MDAGAPPTVGGARVHRDSIEVRARLLNGLMRWREVLPIPWLDGQPPWVPSSNV